MSTTFQYGVLQFESVARELSKKAIAQGYENVEDAKMWLRQQKLQDINVVDDERFDSTFQLGRAVLLMLFFFLMLR